MISRMALLGTWGKSERVKDRQPATHVRAHRERMSVGVREILSEWRNCQICPPPATEAVHASYFPGHGSISHRRYVPGSHPHAPITRGDIRRRFIEHLPCTASSAIKHECPGLSHQSRGMNKASKRTQGSRFLCMVPNGRSGEDNDVCDGRPRSSHPREGSP